MTKLVADREFLNQYKLKIKNCLLKFTCNVNVFFEAELQF